MRFIRATKYNEKARIPVDQRQCPISYILVHRNTAGSNIEQVARFHRETLGWRLFPYQYFLDDAGNEWAPYQVGTLDLITPHVDGKSMSRFSEPEPEEAIALGINWDFRRRPPPDSMFPAMVETLAFLMARAQDYNRTHFDRPDIWPRIEPHDNVVKMCPGVELDFGMLREEVWTEVEVNVGFTRDWNSMDEHANHLPLWWP